MRRLPHRSEAGFITGQTVNVDGGHRFVYGRARTVAGSDVPGRRRPQAAAGTARRPLPGGRHVDGGVRRRRAQAHPLEPRHDRGRHPRGHVGHRDQHARAPDRARRGRTHRIHRRGLRRAARRRCPRPLHRHPRRGDGAPRRAREALRHVPRRPVQGALARGHAEPVLQHAVRHRAERRGRAQGGQEPPLVPRALVHAARRLRPLGRALRRRNRRLLPGAAHRGHRKRRHDLLLGRRVPGGGARARLQRRRGRLPAERGRPDDHLGLGAGRDLAAPEPRPRTVQLRSTCSARTSAPCTSIRRCGIRSTSAAEAHTSATTSATSSRTRRRASTPSSRESSTSRRCGSSG